MKIILASASPRRKELLKQIGMSFKTMPSIKEEKITKDTPEEIVEELSYQKAVDICGQLSDSMKEDFVVIGADTIVSIWGEVMGKPVDKEDACEMLSKLQGKSHQVYFADLLAETLAFSVSSSDEYLEGYAIGLDELIMNRLRSGQMSPEAHLDLHGLNSIQAFETLRDFIRNSWFKGMRTLLLVPGRGKNSPDGFGILRRKLPSWLTQEPFKRVVLAFCTAQPVDGGPGSVYVLLRKFKKKGPVHWEKMPADADLY